MNMQIGDEDALMARVAGGDVAAARDLSVLLAPRLLAQASRMLGDRAEAEDVVQDTLIRLWRLAPDWQPGQARPSSWAYRVVTNLCIDRMRRGRRMAPLDAAGDPGDETPGAEAQLQDQARRTALYDALKALPDRQRQAIVLRHIEDWSNPDIAAKLDISVEAVESLTARGKRLLKQALGGRKSELGFEDDQT